MFIVEKSYFIILVTIIAHFFFAVSQLTFENGIKEVNTRLTNYSNKFKMKIRTYIPIIQSYACRLPPNEKKNLCLIINGVLEKKSNLVFRKDTSDSRDWSYKCIFEKIRFIEGPKTGSFTWMKIFRCPVYVLKRSVAFTVFDPYINDYIGSKEFYVSNGDELNTVFLYNRSPYNREEFLVDGYASGLDYAKNVPRSKILKKFRRHRRIREDDKTK